MTELAQKMMTLGIQEQAPTQPGKRKLASHVDFTEGVAQKKVFDASGELLHQWEEAYSLDEEGRLFMTPKF